MLLMDSELDKGLEPEEAERLAAFHAEHHYYEFGFGRFSFGDCGRSSGSRSRWNIA